MQKYAILITIMRKLNPITPDEVDALLPQTQCGLCGYGGCMPYAKALVAEEASINLCPPGGIPTLHALGDLLQRDPLPYLVEMEKKAKPQQVASIREAECIGCMKCIQVCPVDAILGSAKLMHTVIADECSGCELCIPACPVDCIDLLLLAKPKSHSPLQKSEQYRKRFHARQKRLTQDHTKKDKNLKISIKQNQENKSAMQLEEKKKFIQEAIERAKAKKTSLR